MKHREICISEVGQRMSGCISELGQLMPLFIQPSPNTEFFGINQTVLAAYSN